MISRGNKPKPTNYTEKDLQLALWNQFLNNKAVIPNAHYFMWESDLLVVSKAGYVTEYEIKVSVADFKADAKKDRTPWLATGWRERYYHANLRGKWVKVSDGHMEVSRPARFFYAVPHTMFDKAVQLVPEWAGLIIIHRGPHFTTQVVKQAPRMKSKKLEGDALANLITKMMWRYWKLFERKQIRSFMKRNKENQDG